MTITLDRKLLDAAQKALGTRTKVETIRRALAEAMRRDRLNEVLGRAGKVELDLNQEELQKHRSQE
jgi:Arc/MetJ family transcription regulator